MGINTNKTYANFVLLNFDKVKLVQKSQTLANQEF